MTKIGTHLNYFALLFRSPQKESYKNIPTPKVIKPNKFRCFMIYSNYETMLLLIKSENIINQQRVSIPKFFLYANVFIKAPKFPGSWFFCNLKKNCPLQYVSLHEGYLKTKQSFNRNCLWVSTMWLARKRQFLSSIYHMFSIGFRWVMKVNFYGCRKEFL